MTMRSRSRTWPIVASRNFTLLILQRRLSWLACSSGSDRLQARASAAPPGDSIRHCVAFLPGGGCALPGLRSYDLSLIYSPLLLKLPVLTASTSLRRSRKAGWRHKCLIRPTRSLRQRRANVA